MRLFRTLHAGRHVWGRNHKILKILKKGATRSTACEKETTEHTEHTEKHCMWGEKPQNTPNTLKEGLRKGLPGGRVHGKHGPHGKGLHVEKKPRNTPNTLKEGLRKAQPAWGSREWRRRGEVKGRGCALTNQRGRCAPRSPNSADALSYRRRLAHSRRAWGDRSGAATSL